MGSNQSHHHDRSKVGEYDIIPNFWFFQFHGMAKPFLNGEKRLLKFIIVADNVLTYDFSVFFRAAKTYNSSLRNIFLAIRSIVLPASESPHTAFVGLSLNLQTCTPSRATSLMTILRGGKPVSKWFVRCVPIPNEQLMSKLLQCFWSSIVLLTLRLSENTMVFVRVLMPNFR